MSHIVLMVRDGTSSTHPNAKKLSLKYTADVLKDFTSQELISVFVVLSPQWCVSNALLVLAPNLCPLKVCFPVGLICLWLVSSLHPTISLKQCLVVASTQIEGVQDAG